MAPTPTSLDRWVSRALLLLGLALLATALSKPLLLVAGDRAPGHIIAQEGGVSSRGAYGVRYRFTARDGQTHEGTAFTAVKDARFARVNIAYLPALPGWNMPASGGYAAVTGLGWGLAALVALVAGRVIGGRSARTPAP